MTMRNSSAFSMGTDKRGKQNIIIELLTRIKSFLIALQSYGLHKGSDFIAAKDVV
jgi:hypothetical protein